MNWPPGRKDQNRNVSQVRIGAQYLENIKTAASRQHYIKQQQSRALAAHTIERSLTIHDRINPVSCMLQNETKRIKDCGFILRNQYIDHSGHPPPGGFLSY